MGGGTEGVGAEGGREEDVSRQTRAVTRWSVYRAGNP